jgi:nitroimidazol reductase NimA-like FMN-containing flavoprotein (pyridoxamine 5'-phosphate oxidase superfamily)
VTPEHLEPRRRDRGKDEDFIRAALRDLPWGTLAVSAGPGPPHVNTNIFVHQADPDRIYFHTARVGALAEAVREGGQSGVPATFTAATMGRLLPADTALEFSVEYAGVTAFGRLREVPESDEATAALQAILDRYAPHLRPGRDYRAIVAEELRRTAVYRLDVEGWSGKQKTVGEHAGAFTLEVPAPPLG